MIWRLLEPRAAGFRRGCSCGSSSCAIFRSTYRSSTNRSRTCRSSLGRLAQADAAHFHRSSRSRLCRARGCTSSRTAIAELMPTPANTQSFSDSCDAQADRDPTACGTARPGTSGGERQTARHRLSRRTLLFSSRSSRAQLFNFQTFQSQEVNICFSRVS